MTLTLAWIGAALIIAGRVMLSKQRSVGFPIEIAGSAILGLQAVLMQNYGILVLCIVISALDGYGWLCWRRTKKIMERLKLADEIRRCAKIAVDETPEDYPVAGAFGANDELWKELLEDVRQKPIVSPIDRPPPAG
jgi:hypothetical protein